MRKLGKFTEGWRRKKCDGCRVENLGGKGEIGKKGKKKLRLGEKERKLEEKEWKLEWRLGG